MKWLVAATVIVITSGCKSEAPATADMAVPNATWNHDTVRTAADAVVTFAHAVHVGTGMFTLDRTLAVDASEFANIEAIRAETTKNLNGCGSISAGSADGGTGGALIVDFGAQPGCPFNSMQVSGK